MDDVIIAREMQSKKTKEVENDLMDTIFKMTSSWYLFIGLVD